MPVPATDIGLDSIRNELGAGGGAVSLNTLYSYSNIDGYSNPFAGSWHNLSMGLQSPGKFAANIFPYYSSGSNQAVNNWANYYHDEPVKLSYTFASALGPGRDVAVDLFVEDAPGPTFTSPFDTFVLPGGGAPPYSQVDYSTNIPAFSYFFGPGGYYIKARIQALGGFAATVDVIASIDQDFAGQNQDRGNYTQAFGSWFLPAPFDDVLVDGSVMGSGFPTAIAWNKRTEFSVTIM